MKFDNTTQVMVHTHHDTSDRSTIVTRQWLNFYAISTVPTNLDTYALGLDRSELKKNNRFWLRLVTSDRQLNARSQQTVSCNFPALELWLKAHFISR